MNKITEYLHLSLTQKVEIGVQSIPNEKGIDLYMPLINVKLVQTEGLLMGFDQQLETFSILWLTITSVWMMLLYIL